MAKSIHTGAKVTDSGIYQVVGRKNEIILSTGDRVPPNHGKAVDVVLVRKVQH
jgi:hypothetical protein